MKPKTPVLSDRQRGLRVAFVGRATESDRQLWKSAPISSREQGQACFESAVGDREEEIVRRVVVNRQVHSGDVVAATEAPRDADGLWFEVDGQSADSASHVLCIFTADCVPVLIGEPDGKVLALHAGWRGLAAGIVEHGAHSIQDPRRATAWIGPSIGSCCYEVSTEVALAVAAASDAGVVVARGAAEANPHLDLVRAARVQLRRAGIEDVRSLGCCTQCDRDWHSYRREGPGKGRNHAFIWSV